MFLLLSLIIDYNRFVCIKIIHLWKKGASPTASQPARARASSPEKKGKEGATTRRDDLHTVV
jgi:hypothetical protein